MLSVGLSASHSTAGASECAAGSSGWRGPLLPPVVWLFLKIILIAFVMIWIRGTLPRLRYDQLMALGWKVLIPLALINIMVTGAILLL